MNTEQQPMYEWKDINWRKLERIIFKLQKRIYKASNRGDVKLVRRLQKLLIKSWSARAASVRPCNSGQSREKDGRCGWCKITDPEATFYLDK